MIILNPDAPEERQAEILDRVQTLVREGGGVVDHVDDWGRKKLTYQIAHQGDGRYVVVTCSGPPSALEEIDRVLSINKDVVLRALFIRLNRPEAERARLHGAPAPVDERPEGEARPPRRGPRPRRR
jgi:small subunit ribosomal protein S6